jgi:hypothetical protein
MKITLQRAGIILGLALASCSLPTVRAEDCANIDSEVVANIGVIEVAPGVFVLGGLPTPMTVGGVRGLMSSVVTGLRTTGAKGQGAQHLSLVHTFVSIDPDKPGTFTTSDQAIGAPAGKDPNLTIINDVLTIVEGTGVFANADGFIMNHALLDLSNFTLTASMHGRICADGL